MRRSNDSGPARATSASIRPWRLLQEPVRSVLREQSAHARLSDGRGRLRERPRQFGEVQLFTRWTAAPSSAQALIDTAGVVTSAVKLVSGADCAESCWWVVDVCGREVVRVSESDVLTPLDKAAVEARGLQSSRLRARVTWMKSGLGCSVDLDVGTGFRIAIEGANVSVQILGPTGQMFDPPAAVSLPPASAVGVHTASPIPAPTMPELEDGIILDSVITAQVLQCVSTNADRTSRLTQTFERPASDAEFPVAIPARASLLQVSMPAPGLLTPLQFRIGSAPTSPIVRTAFFDVFTLVRSTALIPIPKNASHVTLGAADPLSARRWTLSWELEL